ncbi:MAG: hypothetical protein KC733_01300 [Candidatus Omnitrophica bacterium]|nr:hypothetical protein [Candidatus Omnitrophota bacterium]
MKKHFVWLFLGLFIINGCGQKKEETKFQGVTAKKDFIAEGMEHLKRGDIPRSIYSFDMAIKNEPTNINNYIILGQVYMRLNNFDRAVDTLSAATRVDQNNGEIFYLLATSKALQGKREDAIKIAQRSVDIFMSQRDEEHFKAAVALLKSLTEAPPPESVSQDVSDEENAQMIDNIAEDIKKRYQ